ncbi:MAG: hypothetical protein QOF24_72 [Verrucomicrobiota bacterium]
MLLLLLTLATSACGQKRPTEDELRLWFHASMDLQSNYLMRMLSFSKTNGIDGAPNVYHVEWTAKADFLADCMWGDPPSGQRPFLVTRGIADPNTLAGFSDSFGKVAAHKGDTISMSGEMILENTEKGWRITTIRVNHTERAKPETFN